MNTEDIVDVTQAVEDEDTAPLCHFTPMRYESADDWPAGQVDFWECQHCGHTKEISRTSGEV